MLPSAFDLGASAVAELQGLYGPFSFPERLLQKIWLRGDFARAVASTTDGRRVAVLHPGKWNHLGGPDFARARLRFDGGSELTGDVEVHLHAGDWDAHGHARDRAYDGVVLHVVLFPPDSPRQTIGVDGRPIPVLVLLPLLHHALEEFAAEDAVEVLANRAVTRLPEDLGLLPSADLTVLLRRHAEGRWAQKVHFARLRVQRLGWDEACHHAALEVLGYRFNRPPMLRIAGEWPLSQWDGTALDINEVYARESAAWSLQGVRPANHPRRRLQQYAAWAAGCPNWPTRLAEAAESLPTVEADASTRLVRRSHHFVTLRGAVGQAMGAQGLNGSRFDTLMCDGVLPLLTAHDERSWFGVWYHWFPGDLPPLLMRGLRDLGIFDGRNQPGCHGAAQGLLGWLIEREARR